MPLPRNIKAFTLIEVLIAIAILAFVSTAAYTSFLQSRSTFGFLTAFEGAFSSIRSARSYAITSSEVGGQKPLRYGVWIDDHCIVEFADTGTDDLDYDGDCDDPGDDRLLKKTDFSGGKYKIDVLDSTLNHDPIGLPLEIFYENGTAEVTTKYSANDGSYLILPKDTNKYFAIKVSDGTSSSEYMKYIVFFQVSGLPEEYESLSAETL